MFRTLGPHRTSRHDRSLAAYLAVIAGTVNSAGFVIIGSFTSHVTGNVGQLADQAAVGNGAVALVAAATVGTFFVGAFITGMLVESGLLGRMSRTSAALLLLEASLVAAFIASSAAYAPSAIRGNEAKAMLLGAAMGIQNGLVTRLSGAIVRTTHLTGVVTDLGIEAARWFRFWRVQLGEMRQLRLSLTRTPAIRPLPAKIALLGTIFGAFVFGSTAGALLAVRYSYLSLVPVVALLAFGAIYALISGRSVVQRRPRAATDLEA